MDLGLTGAVAVVAGGTRGIGLAVARALLAEGAAVALVGRDAAYAAEVAAGLAGGRAIGVGADTTDDAAVEAMAEAVGRELGDATILVNCAAAPAGQAAVPPPSGTEWERMALHMNTKVMGYLRTARALLPAMRRAGRGRIVNISGLGALRTGDLVGTVRNVAVTALSKNLADELAGTGIGVVTVHPGLTRTEKVDAMLAARAEREGKTGPALEAELAGNLLLGRLPTADDVAGVIAFLCSPRSTTINGDSVEVGGGVRGPIFY